MGHHAPRGRRTKPGMDDRGVERELKERLEQQEMVARLGQLLQTEPDMERWLAVVTHQLCDALHADAAKILELEPGERSFLLRAAWGLDDRFIGTYREKTGRASESGFTMLQKGPVISEDLRQETRFEVPTILPAHSSR